jgi:hypothetical protein
MIEEPDDRFEQRLRAAAQDYHRPAATPREELWRRIAAARQARRRRRDLITRTFLPWGVGIAAALVLGIGIGRWTAGPSGLPPAATRNTAAASAPAAGTLVYRVAAAEYLTRTEALLTGFRAEARAGRPDVQFARQAHDLLATTRLMLDSPAAQDHRLKGLLEDLEVVLAQIAQLTPSETPEDLQLITQGLEQRSVLLRLRTANPAGPGPVRAEGAL